MKHKCLVLSNFFMQIIIAVIIYYTFMVYSSYMKLKVSLMFFTTQNININCPLLPIGIGALVFPIMLSAG